MVSILAQADPQAFVFACTSPSYAHGPALLDSSTQVFFYSKIKDISVEVLR